MSVLFYGTALFALAFLVHLIIWKIHLPTHQKSILLFLFGAVLIGGVLALNIWHSVKVFGIMPPQEIDGYIQLCVFFISLSLAYIVTYSALEADSPSLVMVMTIARAKEKGLDEKFFERKINNETLLIPRIKDLVSEGLAFLEQGKYRPTQKGIMLARLFILYRGLLKRPQKGG